MTFSHDSKKAYFVVLRPKPERSNLMIVDVSWAAVLCCAVLCCAVLCCAVLCCAVLCCAVAVLCCAVLLAGSSGNRASLKTFSPLRITNLYPTPTPPQKPAGEIPHHQGDPGRHPRHAGGLLHLHLCDCCTGHRSPPSTPAWLCTAGNRLQPPACSEHISQFCSRSDGGQKGTALHLRASQPPARLA